METSKVIRRFAHNNRTYTFRREGNQVIPVRDDDCVPWSTYNSYVIKDGLLVAQVHAYSPALPTIRECQQLIIGDTRTMTTSVHRVVWSATAAEAAAAREQEDADANPDP